MDIYSLILGNTGDRYLIAGSFPTFADVDFGLPVTAYHVISGFEFARAELGRSLAVSMCQRGGFRVQALRTIERMESYPLYVATGKAVQS